MGRFVGQVAIVVGGGQDVGLDVAMRMGREGASIVLVETERIMGERAADLLDAEGIQGRLLVGDPADPAAARWAATTAKLVWGGYRRLRRPVSRRFRPAPCSWPEDTRQPVPKRRARPVAVLPGSDPRDDGARLRAHRHHSFRYWIARACKPERPLRQPGRPDRSDQSSRHVGRQDGHSCQRRRAYR